MGEQGPLGKTFGYHFAEGRGRDVAGSTILDNVNVEIEYSYGGDVIGIFVRHAATSEELARQLAQANAKLESVHQYALRVKDLDVHALSYTLASQKISRQQVTDRILAIIDGKDLDDVAAEVIPSSEF
jgi:hypothetical protein